MDWRAVEENERALRESLAECLASGTEDDLDLGAATELQLGFVRPWLIWLAKHRDNPKRSKRAIVLNIASMLTETAVNAEWQDKEGNPRTPEDAILHLAKAAARQALDLYRHSQTPERDVIFGKPIDLQGRSDA